MQYVFFWGGGRGSLHKKKKKQYKLITLGTVSCFSERDIHCFKANDNNTNNNNNKNNNNNDNDNDNNNNIAHISNKLSVTLYNK